MSDPEPQGKKTNLRDLLRNSFTPRANEAAVLSDEDLKKEESLLEDYTKQSGDLNQKIIEIEAIEKARALTDQDKENLHALINANFDLLQKLSDFEKRFAQDPRFSVQDGRILSQLYFPLLDSIRDNYKTLTSLDPEFVRLKIETLHKDRQLLLESDKLNRPGGMGAKLKRPESRKTTLQVQFDSSVNSPSENPFDDAEESFSHQTDALIASVNTLLSGKLEKDTLVDSAIDENEFKSSIRNGLNLLSQLIEFSNKNKPGAANMSELTPEQQKSHKAFLQAIEEEVKNCLILLRNVKPDNFKQIISEYKNSNTLRFHIDSHYKGLEAAEFGKLQPPRTKEEALGQLKELAVDVQQRNRSDSISTEKDSRSEEESKDVDALLEEITRLISSIDLFTKTKPPGSIYKDLFELNVKNGLNLLKELNDKGYSYDSSKNSSAPAASEDSKVSDLNQSIEQVKGQLNKLRSTNQAGFNRVSEKYPENLIASLGTAEQEVNISRPGQQALAEGERRKAAGRSFGSFCLR